MPIDQIKECPDCCAVMTHCEECGQYGCEECCATLDEIKSHIRWENLEDWLKEEQAKEAANTPCHDAACFEHTYKVVLAKMKELEGENS